MTALLDRRDIERGLKRLKRKRRTSRRRVLDVDATIRHYVDTRVLAPIQQPGQERWLDLALIIDVAETMKPWQRTLGEFAQMVTRLGAFGQVTTWCLDWTDSGKVSFVSERGDRRSVKHLIDPAGRTVTIVATDCVHSGWSAAPVWDVIGEIGRFGPLTIMHLLPRRLWASTQLGEPETSVRAARPGQANSALRVERPWWWDSLEDGVPGRAVPVAGLQAERLAMWARLVTGAQQAEVPAVLLESFAERSATLQPIAPVTDPRQRVSDVERTISPTAFRLAVLLSAVPLSVTVAQLVQAAEMPDSSTEHLAEVWSSGLIKLCPSGGYEFGDGVRRILQEQLTASSAAAVHTSVIARLQLDSEAADLTVLGINSRTDALAVTEQVLDRFGLAGSGFDSARSGEMSAERILSPQSVGPGASGEFAQPPELEPPATADPARILVLGRPGRIMTMVTESLAELEPSPIIRTGTVDEIRPTHIVVVLNKGDDIDPEVSGQVASFVSLFSEPPSSGLPVVVCTRGLIETGSVFSAEGWGREALVLPEELLYTTRVEFAERLTIYPGAESLYSPADTTDVSEALDVLKALALHFHVGGLDVDGGYAKIDEHVRALYGLSDDESLKDYRHVRHVSEFMFTEIEHYIAGRRDLLAWSSGETDPGQRGLRVAASHFFPRQEGEFLSFVGIKIEEAIALGVPSMPVELEAALADVRVRALLARFLTPLRLHIGPEPSSFHKLGTDPVAYVNRLCDHIEFYFERAAERSSESSKTLVGFSIPYRSVVGVLGRLDSDYRIDSLNSDGHAVVELSRIQLPDLMRYLCKRVREAMLQAKGQWPTADEHAALRCSAVVGEPM